VSTTASQLHTAPSSIFLETNPDQMQSCPSPIQENSCSFPPRTWSSPLPTLDQMQPPTTLPKMMKSVCAKTKPQWKSSKETKGKQSLMQTTMMNANPKYVRGEPVLTTEQLHEAGQYCVELHNYYIMNYKTSQEIIIQFKDRHFLVGDDIFVITFSDLYKLFNLDTLDISLMHCFTM
jgi:hypothetical protein